ncbi:MAG: hypothetical protein KAW09_00620 [Thermoplasmata archaeon]|nr:hypothetical protein [Thermoplasmata archaeon]
MKSFSQRKGYKPVRTEIQVGGMDEALRNSLWNALDLYIWDRMEGAYIQEDENIHTLFTELWAEHLKLPLDTLDSWWPTTLGETRELFFSLKWFEIYDFMEFVAEHYPDENITSEYVDYCNQVLEKEMSAYRFVGGRVTEITSEEEIEAIEEALTIPAESITTHLKSALDLLTDRKAPDYRNSIKESISAVEGICKLVAGDDKATLGKALRVIGGKVGLHSDLEEAFRKIYHYTSDADGIRHALMDEPNLSFEDAKFMLVSCSAFVNYLISKSSKAGIKL